MLELNKESAIEYARKTWPDYTPTGFVRFSDTEGVALYEVQMCNNKSGWKGFADIWMEPEIGIYGEL